MTGTFPYPNSLATADIAWHNKEPVRSGSRVYWIEGQYNTNEKLRCWDAAVNAGAGGICDGAGWPGLTENRGYALTIDPDNPLCVWSNGDPGQIKVWDYDGTPGCEAPLPDVTFDAEVVVPRMACDGPGRVRRWVEFRMIDPVASDYTSAVLSVATAAGTPIAGWQNLPIVVDGNGDRVVDLSGLDVDDSGIDPQFTIRFVGRTVANDVTARIVAVGDAPQLCLDLDPYPAACPAGPGPQPDPLPAPPATTVGATGRVTLASDSTETEFTPADATLAQDARADADCLGGIAGEATEDGSGAPIAGATVYLLDGSGATLDQAVTDANGAYQFTRLAAGSDYRVRFGSSSLVAPDAPTDGSATTPRTVTAGATLEVDGVYAILPTAPDRAATGMQGTALRLDPFGADGASPAATAGTGATLIPGDTLLCATDEVAPACTRPELTTPEGTWRVDGTTGQVTFTPAPDFVGTAGPIAYRVITTLGTTAHATLRVTLTARPADPAPPVVTPAPVVVPPSALPDATSTPRGVAVTLDVLANDGAGLLGSTLQVRNPRTGAWVTSFVASGQGTWQVIDGAVRFTPLRDFTGTVTPLTYRASTAGGAVATSTATVRVLPGNIPWANPDFRQGMSGERLVFAPLDNDARPEAIIASSVRLQDPRTGAWVLSVTIRGEGTWSVDPASGQISFVHAPGFVGRTTPVRYRASGRFGTVSQSLSRNRAMESATQSIDSTVTALIRTTGPALQITTTAARTTLRPGARTTVTLAVINPGTAAATSTRVCATLPRGLRLVGRPAGALVSGRAVCMSAGDMAAGATVTYRLSVVALRPGLRAAVGGAAAATNVAAVYDAARLRVLAPPVRVTG